MNKVYYSYAYNQILVIEGMTPFGMYLIDDGKGVTKHCYPALLQNFTLLGEL